MWSIRALGTHHLGNPLCVGYGEGKSIPESDRMGGDRLWIHGCFLPGCLHFFLQGLVFRSWKEKQRINVQVRSTQEKNDVVMPWQT